MNVFKFLLKHEHNHLGTIVWYCIYEKRLLNHTFWTTENPENYSYTNVFCDLFNTNFRIRIPSIIVETLFNLHSKQTDKELVEFIIIKNNKYNSLWWYQHLLGQLWCLFIHLSLVM